MTVKSRIKNTNETDLATFVPSLQTLARAKENMLACDAEFQKLLINVRDELKEKFFGTYATVEVTQYKKHHLQLLMFLYRELGWHISSLADEGKEYLRFRDPRSIMRE